MSSPVHFEIAPEFALCREALARHGEIHVWRLELDTLPTSPADCLDASQAQRLATIRDPLRQQHYLAVRCAMRQILSAYLGWEVGKLPLATRPGGKPAIALPRCPIEFNLTHTGELALLAVANNLPLGIDVERLRAEPRAEAIVRRLFDEREAESFCALPADRQSEAFFHLWTAMEARQKTFGHGIFGERVDPATVETRHFSPKQDHLAALCWPKHKRQRPLRFLQLRG